MPRPLFGHTSTAKSAIDADYAHACLGAAWSVCLSVCLSVSVTHYRDKMAEPTEMPFGSTRAYGCKEPCII